MSTILSFLPSNCSVSSEDKARILEAFSRITLDEVLSTLVPAGAVAYYTFQKNELVKTDAAAVLTLLSTTMAVASLVLSKFDKLRESQYIAGIINLTIGIGATIGLTFAGTADPMAATILPLANGAFAIVIAALQTLKENGFVFPSFRSRGSDEEEGMMMELGTMQPS